MPLLRSSHLGEVTVFGAGILGSSSNPRGRNQQHGGTNEHHRGRDSRTVTEISRKMGLLPWLVLEPSALGLPAE